MPMIRKVVFAERVSKRWHKLPRQVLAKLLAWAAAVETSGLDEVRKIPGFHDEPIRAGAHAGQRSVRLNRSWRAFYRITTGAIEFVAVEDVNKHEYDR